MNDNSLFTFSQLQVGSENGDVDCLFQLAIWYLVGTNVPRDLIKARALLRQVISIGHVDAALMEIAFTANGTGSLPDWRLAVELLQESANSDTLAAEYLGLLNNMSLDPEGGPSTLPDLDILRSSPNISVFSNFISAAEAAHIVSLVAADMEPATVADPVSGRQIPHPIRKSDNAVIGPARESLVVQAINKRIAYATNTSTSSGEPLTVLRYRPGQQYKAHLDTLPHTSNQRTKTAILYLNEGFRGGETIFPSLGISITPEAGRLLIFSNVDDNGSPDPLSRHAGLPVHKGTKWIATRWIRARSYNSWTDYGN